MSIHDLTQAEAEAKLAELKRHNETHPAVIGPGLANRIAALRREMGYTFRPAALRTKRQTTVDASG